MKKILAMLIAVLMIVSVCALTGCGDKKETTSTTPTEAPTEVVSEKDAKQATYESMLNDPSKIQLNSKNLVGILKSPQEKILDVESSASGDNKMTMYLSENLGYTTYTIGEDSYIEMHIPEYKDDNGKTVKAEDVYYKTHNNGPTDMTAENITSSLQLTKENIVSVKYVETKDFHGVNCDAVEVVHKVSTNSDTKSETVNNNVNAQNNNETVNETTENVDGTEVGTTENVEETVGVIEDVAKEETTEAKPKIVEITSTLYFTADGNKLFGCETTQEEMLLECYFPNELKVELPKDVKFVDADDDKISKKMLSLYTVLFSQTNVENETVASTEASTEAATEATPAG